jgi:hypothetical protein
MRNDRFLERVEWCSFGVEALQRRGNGVVRSYGLLMCNKGHNTPESRGKL